MQRSIFNACHVSILRLAYASKSHLVLTPTCTLAKCTTTRFFHQSSAKRLWSSEDAPVKGASQSRPRRHHGSELERLMEPVKLLHNRIETMPDNTIPQEDAVISALHTLRTAANKVVEAGMKLPAASSSSLLAIEADSNDPTAQVEDTVSNTMPAPYRDAVLEISSVAFDLISHPNVFISPVILGEYVIVQYKLSQPETLAHVFELYAKKPMPRSTMKKTVRYVKQNPNKASSHIPNDVADLALDTAIAAKNLDAAVAIIESSMTTPAFYRNKLLKRAFMPAMAVLGTPIIGYRIAYWLAGFQNTMDPTTATWMFFTGIMAYVVFTGSLGFIALATTNDNIKRVSWAPGMPLRHRWIREEERAAYEKVAMAWGFREAWRHGEESGPEWANLKEFMGQRGLLLDRVELMEGMQ